MLSNLHTSLPWALENFRLLFTITPFPSCRFCNVNSKTTHLWKFFHMQYSHMRGGTVIFFLTHKCQLVSQSNTKPESFQQDFSRWYLGQQVCWPKCFSWSVHQIDGGSGVLQLVYHWSAHLTDVLCWVGRSVGWDTNCH